MAKRKPVVWCTPLVGAQRYDVTISNHESSPHLDEGDEAACDWHSTTVVISDTLSDERKIDCLAHELFVHALLEATGLGRNFRSKLGITEKQWEVFEEECLARQYAPALLAMLKANGWLQLPKLPQVPRSRTPSRPKSPKKKSKKVVKR